jgi:hypothetical protein
MTKRGRPIGTRAPDALVGTDAIKKRHSRAKKAMDTIFGPGSDNLSDDEWNKFFDEYDKTKWDQPKLYSPDSIVTRPRQKNPRFQAYLDRKRKQ